MSYDRRRYSDTVGFHNILNINTLYTESAQEQLFHIHIAMENDNYCFKAFVRVRVPTLLAVMKSPSQSYRVRIKPFCISTSVSVNTVEDVIVILSGYIVRDFCEFWKLENVKKNRAQKVQ